MFSPHNFRGREVEGEEGLSIFRAPPEEEDSLLPQKYFMSFLTPFFRGQKCNAGVRSSFASQAASKNSKFSIAISPQGKGRPPPKSVFDKFHALRSNLLNSTRQNIFGRTPFRHHVPIGMSCYYCQNNFSSIARSGQLKNKSRFAEIKSSSRRFFGLPNSFCKIFYSPQKNSKRRIYTAFFRPCSPPFSGLALMILSLLPSHPLAGSQPFLPSPPFLPSGQPTCSRKRERVQSIKQPLKTLPVIHSDARRCGDGGGGDACSGGIHAQHTKANVLGHARGPTLGSRCMETGGNGIQRERK